MPDRKKDKTRQKKALELILKEYVCVFKSMGYCGFNGCNHQGDNYNAIGWTMQINELDIFLNNIGIYEFADNVIPYIYFPHDMMLINFNYTEIADQYIKDSVFEVNNFYGDNYENCISIKPYITRRMISLIRNLK